MSLRYRVALAIKALLGLHPPSPEKSDLYRDVTEEEWAIINRCQPFTMTSIDRLVASIRSVDHINTHQIPGDLVECGVWKGGSAMAMAMTLVRRGDTSRQVYLYDTFTGMTPPEKEDQDFNGTTAEKLLVQDPDNYRCEASMEEVSANMSNTGYPASQINLIKGPVEETIPSIIPEKIALLRLDTDWLASTRHEMIHLFPRLVQGGIIIIDDYGHWKGSRQAVDEYLSEHNIRLFLSRIDYSGRIGVKHS